MADIRPPSEISNTRTGPGPASNSVITNANAQTQALPPGTTLTGQVLARTAQGQIQVKLTDGQIVQLQTNLPLTVGRQVTLTVQQNGPLPQVAVQATTTPPPNPQPRTNPTPPPATPGVTTPQNAAVSTTNFLASAQAASAAARNPGQPLPIAQALAAIFVPAQKREPNSANQTSVTVGRVLGQQNGLVQVQTAYGRIQVPYANPLPKDSMVRLHIPPGSQEGVELFPIADDTDPAAQKIGQQAYAAQDPGKSSAQKIQIQLQTTGDNTKPNVVQGEVVFVTDEHVTVRTPRGMITVPGNFQTKPGVMLWVELPPEKTAAAAPPPTSSASASVPGQKTLPSLQQLQDLWLKQPSLALQHFLQQTVPQPGAKMPAQVLFYLAAASGQAAQAWFGTKLMRELQDKNIALADALESELLEAGSDDESEAPQPWRHAAIPIFDGQQMQYVQLFARRQREDDPEGQGQRFVIEANLTRLGPLQLDGLIRERNCQLVLRSNIVLADTLQQDIRQIFQDYMDLSGYEGSIRFQQIADFPVKPAVENQQLHSLAVV